MNIVIINMHYKHRDLPGTMFYVARPRRGDPPSPLANRYSHLNLPHVIKVDSIEEAISRNRTDLEQQIKNRDRKVCNELNKIYYTALDSTVYLGCWCMDELKPSKRDHGCHAENIREIVLRRYEELSKR